MTFLRLLSKSFSNIHSRDISFAQRVLDPLYISASFLFLTPHELPEFQIFGIPAWSFIAVSCIILLPSSGIYTSYRQKSLKLLARRITSRWLIIVGVLLFFAFIEKSSENLSRIHVLFWGFQSWAWLFIFHVISRKFIRRLRMVGFNKRSVVYWGSPAAARSFINQLSNAPWMGLELQAWFSPYPPDQSDDLKILSKYRGGINSLKAWLESSEVDKLFFSHATANESGVEQIINLLGDISVPVFYAPNWAHPTMRFTIDTIGSQPCISLWGQDQALLERQSKRFLDLILSSTILILISPFLLLIAIAIVVDSPGSILYVQQRYGLDGKPFKCYKFRSMFSDYGSGSDKLKQATENDVRVTRVGRFIRKWSLDELPQLFNVLHGEMSLVGPRPHAVEHNEIYRKMIPGYMQRHAFKPGITGLAQVEGWRGETKDLSEMENRIYADLIYQRDWSLILDIKILLKTILRLRSEKAY